MDCSKYSPENQYEAMRAHLREHLNVTMGEDAIRGVEISGMIREIGNLYHTAIINQPMKNELSSQRMGILIRLMVEEDNGNTTGVNPTVLSHYQRVKKNTISSLIRGLEDDGYVERTLNTVDKRAFLIRITEKGKNLVKESAPLRFKFMNELSSDLTDEEKTQLLALLEKLMQSIRNHAAIPQHPTER